MGEPYRKTSEELNYYGSDYNKFLHEECSREMTVINIDTIQYKRSKRILRIIESKHIGEKIPFAQMEILRLIARIFKYLNGYEIYLIQGNYPYEIVTIMDLIGGTQFTCKDKKMFIKFSEFEISYEELRSNKVPF